MFNKKFFSILIISILVIFVCVNYVFAEYPEKEVTVICPWSAGGGTDLIGRIISSLLGKELGVPFVVVNKTGGGGTVGFKTMAIAKPDGYTIGLISISMILQKYTLPSSYVDYKTIKPIALINGDPASLTVKSDAPWDNIHEFIKYAKENPKKIRVSNSGPGAVWHTAARLMENKLGLEFTHVPYEGGNPAAVAVAGGHVEATTVSPPEVASLVEAGKLRILAIPAEERLDLFPDVPTFKEEGMDFSFGCWRALAAPKDTPDEVVNVLEKAIKKAIESQDFVDFMKNGGYGILYLNSEKTMTYMEKMDKDLGEILEQ